MKRNFLLKTMLLLCALVAGSSSMWAVDDVTVTWNVSGVVTTQTDASGGQVNTALATSSITPSGASGTWTAYSSTATSYAGSNSGAQLGAGSKSGGPTREFNGTITLSNTSIPSNATIKSVTVNATSNGSSTLSATVGGNSLGDSKTISGTTATDYVISGSSQTGNSIVLTLSNTTAGKNIVIKKIIVVYTPSTETINVTGVSLNKTETSLFVGESEQLTATIAPTYATNKNVSWESDDESVATVDNEGNVTAIAKGTATITVTTENGGYTASCTVTVVPAPPLVVTLDFTDAGWGFPSAYTLTEETYTNNGYTITLGEGSTGHKKIMNGDDIASLIFGKKDATLTLPAFGFNVSKLKVYGYSSAGANVTFNVYVGTTAVSTEVTSSKVTHEFVIAADKQDVGTIYTIKVTNANNCQISKIEVFGNGCEAGVVGEAGWATYVTSCDMEFVDGEAFVVESASSSSATLTGVTQVPAGVPVMLKGTGAKTAIALDAAPAAVTNKLAVSDGSAVDGYVLAKKSGVVGFYKWDGGTLSSGKVYLPTANVGASSLDFIAFDINGETTGISEVKTTKLAGEFFDLQGRKVAQPTKGLYIVNGKKVIIK